VPDALPQRRFHMVEALPLEPGQYAAPHVGGSRGTFGSPVEE
jgi:hypothetical protein